MVHSPDNKPLRELTEGQLRQMAAQAARNVDYSANDVTVELTYREQRRLSKWVAILIGGTLIANVVAIVLNAVL